MANGAKKKRHPGKMADPAGKKERAEIKGNLRRQQALGNVKTDGVAGAPTADSGPGAQWEAPDLHVKMHKSRHILLSFDGARSGSGLGAAAWILWLRGRVLRSASAMIAEREPCQWALNI